MSRKEYKSLHRVARLGNLGTLAFSTTPGDFQWFLREVYDLRFPHIGDSRHNVRRSFCVHGRRDRAPRYVVGYAKHYRPVKCGVAVNLP